VQGAVEVHANYRSLVSTISRVIHYVDAEEMPKVKANLEKLVLRHIWHLNHH